MEQVEIENSKVEITIIKDGKTTQTIKDKTKAEKWNLQTILGIASSLGSLGLTAASVANILK